MPAEKYSKKYLEDRLPALIREHLRQDGLRLSKVPSYDYLQSKGIETRSLNTAIQRHFGSDMTLHSFLEDQGFGTANESKYPTDHPETAKFIEDFTRSREKRGKQAEATIDTIETALRRILVILEDLYGEDNLLRLARYDTDEEKIKHKNTVIDVLDELDKDLSRNTVGNYGRYWRDFYDYVNETAVIDFNPVEGPYDMYDFNQKPSDEPLPLSDEMVKKLWDTLLHLPSQTHLPSKMRGLLSRHGREEWRLQMMVLIVFLISAGPRTGEIIRCDCRNHLHFGEAPSVEYPQRKNGPGEVALLVNAEFLEGYVEYMNKKYNEWNGKLLPSENSESGSRVGDTINNWLDALCKTANVKLENGETPNIQNVRQTWHTNYFRALRHVKIHTTITAKEQDTETVETVGESYVPTEEEQHTIRQFVKSDFQELLEYDRFPDIMSSVINESNYNDFQEDLFKYED